jgi:glycosyltransferase involved in cell wall biosynthesis
VPTSFPRIAGDPRRLLIIRGDLRSRTGFAYLSRAQARLVETEFEILGVDVHPDPNDREGMFPYPIISDDELPRRIATGNPRPIVLHLTPVNDFRSFAGAWNIGSFAWETDVAPRLRHWALKIGLMDAMWAHCSMVAELIRGLGYPSGVHIITWPFDFAQGRRSDPGLRRTISVQLFGELGVRGFDVRTMSLAEARLGARNLFVTVQSMSARKGLPILLSEWRQYTRGSANSHDLLILRLAFRHASNLTAAPNVHLADMLQDAGFIRRENAQIGIITETMSDAALTELYQACDAYVSTTLGEGFGGPIMEAIVNGRPVIVPRHTAMSDYIAPDYPLIVASKRRIVSLRGGLPDYPPATAWHLPCPGAMATCLTAFSQMTESHRAELVRGLRSCAEQFCSMPVVRHSMTSFFRELFAGSSADAALV